MTEKKSLLQWELSIADHLPGNSIDCVIFGYKNQELQLLLLHWKHHDTWSLPGGFIGINEDMDEAANRILLERTGLDSVFLNQFYTFGGTKRSKMNEAAYTKRMEFLTKSKIYSSKTMEWLTKRFITTGYFALVDHEKTTPKPDFLSDKCDWIALHSLPELLMDHGEIIQKALEHLRVRLNYLPIGFSLLPKKFTMQDLQKLYEAILQRPLERSNFQRKMLKLDILTRHEKQMTGAANKAPFLYSFNKERYELLLRKGIGFSF